MAFLNQFLCDVTLLGLSYIMKYNLSDLNDIGFPASSTRTNKISFFEARRLRFPIEHKEHMVNDPKIQCIFDTVIILIFSQYTLFMQLHIVLFEFENVYTWSYITYLYVICSLFCLNTLACKISAQKLLYYRNRNQSYSSIFNYKLCGIRYVFIILRIEFYRSSQNQRKLHIHKKHFLVLQQHNSFLATCP